MKLNITLYRLQIMKSQKRQNTSRIRKENTSSNSIPLTQSEIDSLRKEFKESGKKLEKMFQQGS